MTRLEAANDRWYAALAAGIRLVSLAIGAISLLQRSELEAAAVSLAALAVVAVASTLANFIIPGSSWVSPAEATLAALAVSAGGDQALALLPYLAVPAFSAGLLRGMRASLWTTAAAAVTLALAFHPWSAALVQQVLTWLVVGIGVGLLAGWVHLLRSKAEVAEQHSYEEATKLLDELRQVIRPLSGGLDPRPLADQMMQEIADVVPCTGAAVVLGLDGSRELIATRGHTPEGGWTTALSDDGVVTRRITTGDREIGQVAILPTQGTVSDDDAHRLGAVLRLWSPRLEAAGLYYAVRDLATRAERSRLAREMHDGVAQDIASLGYLVDDLAADLPPENLAKVESLRTQLSEVVTGLRLSIHDLRHEGLQTSGLAASVSELARQEARMGGMRLHLRVQEGASSLTPGVEHDMYRIAQEALANARQHSQAQNLWVSCQTGLGGTALGIEDDGVGLPVSGTTGLGIQTMTERSLRIGARLTLDTRSPVGTMVRVEYNTPTMSGTP